MPTVSLNPEVQRRHDVLNGLHTTLLLVATGIIMGLMAYTVFGVSGLVSAAVMGVIGLAGLGRASPRMILGLYKARPIAPDEAGDLHRIVRHLASAANLTSVPSLYYVPSQLLNAFAVGKRDDAAIAVTDGLLRVADERQLAGILAHEMAHITNGDLTVMGLADMLNRITSFMSTLGLLGVPLVFGMGVQMPVAGLLLMIFAPTISGLLQLGLSRAREYDADLEAAKLTGDPLGLASALQMLEQRQGRVLEGLFLPGSRLPQPSMLRTHPRTEDRIARLRALVNGNETLAPPKQASPSFVPKVPQPELPPHIRWHRFGIYY